MLPSKWHRAAIGAAGMYVEICLASVATFLWWFSAPGLFNHICLSVMFICSTVTTCAGICPTATANLLQVQKMLGARVGRDIFFYSITLEPELDTPQSLKDYADRHHIGPGWLFLTGTPASVQEVRVALGFYDPDPIIDADKTSHSGMLRVGNDAYDRWTMAPTQATPVQILSTIDHVDRTALRA